MARRSRECGWSRAAAPVVTPGGGSPNYTENAAPVTVDSAVAISDSDAVTNDINGATVQITGNYVQGQDTLAFTAPGGSGITGFFSADTGKLVLSGASSMANYQTALQSVTYVNSSDNPSTTLELSRTSSTTPAKCPAPWLRSRCPSPRSTTPR